MRIVLLIFITGLLVMAGCTNESSGQVVSSLSDRQLETIVDSVIVCNTPYIRFEAGCCLDQNNNLFCDADESLAVNATFRMLE